MDTTPGACVPPTAPTAISMVQELDHIGIAVSDTAKLVRILESLLGLKSLFAEEVTSQGVRVEFLDATSTKLEVLEAIHADSPIAKFVRARKGGLHHLAFTVPDIEEAFVKVKGAGLTPLSAAPQPGAGGKKMFFMHPKETAGVLIELCQRNALPVAVVVAVPSPEFVGMRVFPTMQEAHDGMATPQAHLIVVGGDACLVHRTARESSEKWLSLTLHDMDMTADDAMLESFTPTLVCAPDIAASSAFRLHRHITGSRLCILPTRRTSVTRTDPALFKAVVSQHMNTAIS